MPSSNSSREGLTVREALDWCARSLPYIVFAYAAVLVVVRVAPSVERWFYWPALHALVIALMVVTLSNAGRRKIAAGTLRTIMRRKLNVADYGRIGVSVALIVLALWVGTGIIGFLVLVYGIVAVVFRTITPRVNLAIGLGFLVLCAILTSLKYTNFAQQSAIFALEFLAFSVVSQLVENFVQNSQEVYPQTG
jgi:hypothetical protein